MKKLTVLAMIIAVTLVVAAFAHAQTPPNDLKPTFISPTPGFFVNGWPAFTVSYPKEWEEMPLPPGAVFFAAGTRPDLPPSPVFGILVFSSVLPLEDWAKYFMPVWINIWTDIKVLSDKPSRLKDGTPAREVEFEFVPKIDPLMRSIKSGRKENGLLLATKKDTSWVAVLSTAEEKAGEDLKRIAYSLTFQPDREKPVQVPPDVRAFLDMYSADMMGHDVKAFMEHFSDRFFQGGTSKKDMELWFRNDPFSPIQRGIISNEATVTVFEPRGDKAYVDGFLVSKAKSEANAWKTPITFQQIINEHGEWKWLGNRR